MFQKAGVPLHKFEMRMLAKSVSEKGRNSKPGSVDYKFVPISSSYIVLFKFGDLFYLRSNGCVFTSAVYAVSK